MGAIPIYPQEGKKKAEHWNVIISTNPICLLLCPRETGMPMQATPSPWCLVVTLQLAAYSEGFRCDRAFSVFQSTGKGCTIRQDCALEPAECPGACGRGNRCARPLDIQKPRQDLLSLVRDTYPHWFLECSFT